MFKPYSFGAGGDGRANPLGDREMPVPSTHDINPVPEDLDGQCAERHFIGKTLSDAVKLFEDNYLSSFEDLTHMGDVAFTYYVPAAIEYAESGAVKFDCAVAHALLNSMVFWWHDQHNVEQRDLFRGYCERVLDRIDGMDLVFAPDYRLERQFRRFLDRLNSN